MAANKVKVWPCAFHADTCSQTDEDVKLGVSRPIYKLAWVVQRCRMDSTGGQTPAGMMVVGSCRCATAAVQKLSSIQGIDIECHVRTAFSAAAERAEDHWHELKGVEVEPTALTSKVWQSLARGMTAATCLHADNVCKIDHISA
jgi:hypothetical protein